MICYISLYVSIRSCTPLPTAARTNVRTHLWSCVQFDEQFLDEVRPQSAEGGPRSGEDVAPERAFPSPLKIYRLHTPFIFPATGFHKLPGPLRTGAITRPLPEEQLNTCFSKKHSGFNLTREMLLEMAAQQKDGNPSTDTVNPC